MNGKRAPLAPTSHDGLRKRAALLVLAGVLVYANGLNGPFIFDDYTAIESNEQIRQLWPLSAPLSPPRDTPVAGRPLVNLTLAVNYALGGLDVRGYHVTNLFIHLLAALALFGVVRRTLELDVTGSPLRVHASNVAFVSALIWMLHPLQTEVVDYVTQRTTSLKGLMFFLTLYCSIRAHAVSGGRRTSNAAPRHGRWQAAAVLASAAGMACKESMATAPLLIVMFDRVFLYPSLREAFERRRTLYAGLASTWIVLAALVASRPRTTVGFGAGVDAWTYLLNQSTIIVNYLRLTVWPRALVVDYGVPQQLLLGDVLVPALAVCGLLLATLVALARWPRVGFLGAWFFVTLAPTSSFVPIVTEVGAERRMYLPLAAIVVLAVCSVSLAVVTRRVSRAVAVTLCAGVCVTLAAGTVVRNREYRTRLSLAETVIERRPHGRAYLRFGGLLLEAGRRSEAIGYFHQAKSVGAVGSRFALGTEYLVDGDLDAGVRELSDFVRRHPTHINVVPAREMLGRAFAAQGRWDDAIHEYTQILKLVPRHVMAHAAIGDILLGQDRPAAALPHLEYVSAVRSGDVDALGKLGSALAASGRFAEAVDVFAAAVAVDPRSQLARSMLGRALATQGRLREALVHFELAVDLAPDDVRTREDLEEVRRLLDTP